MSQEQLREVEAAREQALLAREKFEKIRQAQQAEHGELPSGPRGRPAEAVPHRKIEVSQLKHFPEQKPLKGRYFAEPSPFRLPKGKAARARPTRGFRRGPRIIGPFVQRVTPTFFRPKEETPANIDRAEKEKALTKLDNQIARWSRKYAFRVVHGGTTEQKNEAAMKLRQLQSEREAIGAMKPRGQFPFHIRRAEGMK